MAFEDQLFVWISRVEIEHLYVFAILAGEEMSTVCEFYLVGALDVDTVVFLKLFLEDVEHSDGVGETNYHVEAWRVHGDWEGLLFELLHDLRFQSVLMLAIVPYTDGAITRASSQNSLLETDIHTKDRMRVEATNKVVVLLKIVRIPTIERYRHLEDLIWAHGEHDTIFLGGKSHTCHFHIGEVTVELRICIQISLVR